MEQFLQDEDIMQETRTKGAANVVQPKENDKAHSPREQSFIVHENVQHEDGVVSRAALSSMRGDPIDAAAQPKHNNFVGDNAYGEDEQARKSDGSR